jgi:hypothetical protein
VVSPLGSDTLWQQFNTIETEQYCGFAEFTYEVSDQLRFIAGARYVREEIVNTTRLSTSAVGSGPSRFEAPFVLRNLNDVVGGRVSASTGRHTAG